MVITDEDIAYLSDIAPKFSPDNAYVVPDMVVMDGVLKKCTVPGTGASATFVNASVQDVIKAVVAMIKAPGNLVAMLLDLAPEYEVGEEYHEYDLVIKDGELQICVQADPVIFQPSTVQNAIARIRSSDVVSVNGKTGAVVLTGADIAVSGSDETTIDVALAGKASKADATLTERGFSAWTIVVSPPPGMEFEAVGQPYYENSGWHIEVRYRATGEEEWVYDTYDQSGGDDGEDSLHVVCGTLFDCTRTVLSGYVLGSQTDNPLASEAEAEALRMGKVPTSRKVNGTPLSSDVTLTGADIMVSGSDPTKIDAALAGKATKADATLIPVYDGNGKKFSDWVCVPATYEGNPITIVETPSEETGMVNYTPYSNGSAIGRTGTASEDILSLRWRQGVASLIDLTATRTANKFLGYQLGEQNDKPLQPAGDYVPVSRTVNGKELLSDVTLTGADIPVDATQGAQKIDAALAGKQDALSDTQLANIAAVSDALAFDATHTYEAGDPVVYNGTLYTFTATHTGAWTGSDVSAVDIIARLANVVHKTGDETIEGVKTFDGNAVVTGDITIHGFTKTMGVTLNDVAGGYVGGDSSLDHVIHIRTFEDTDLGLPAGDVTIPRANGVAALTAGSGHTGNLAALDSNGNPTDSGIPKTKVVETPVYDGQNHEFLDAAAAGPIYNFTAAGAHSWAAPRGCIVYLRAKHNSDTSPVLYVHVNNVNAGENDYDSMVFKESLARGSGVVVPIFLNAGDTLDIRLTSKLSILNYSVFYTDVYLVPGDGTQLLGRMSEKGIDVSGITDYGGVATALGLGDTTTPQDAIDAVMGA